MPKRKIPSGRDIVNAKKKPVRPKKDGENVSGIEVGTNSSSSEKYGITATVPLSRVGMGMMQQRRKDKPLPAKNMQSVATADSVACPKCQISFPITPEAYGAVAECSECSSEFTILAPN